MRDRPVIRAVIFDFDGVILESVDLKGRAFRRLFGAYPAHLDAIERLHRENCGMSRYEKFRRIHRDILDLPLSDARVRDLDREFGAIVAEEILTCPFVPGALACLAARARDQRLFLASATPDDELCATVDRRGLRHFFDGVYGSPRTKQALLQSILQENGLAGRQAVFVGDARQDYEAAAAVGVPFIGRLAPGSPSPFPGPPAAVVADLTELEARWPSLAGRLVPWTVEDRGCS